MIFEQLNPHACRTYLIGDEKSRETILVDPVLEHVEDYPKTLDQRKLKLTHVMRYAYPCGSYFRGRRAQG